MGDQTKYRITVAVVLIFTWAAFFCIATEGALAKEPQGSTIVVEWVIDGDTIELTNGERVRYVGIDTPEREESFYEEARAMNVELLGGGDLTFEPCALESRDRYGRLLGWVYAGELDVGGRLLSLGLAKTLLIAPCGMVKEQRYGDAEAVAKEGRIGLWGDKEAGGEKVLRIIRLR